MSQSKPLPIDGNADGWCAGPVRVLHRREEAVSGPTGFVSWAFSRSVDADVTGYIREITVECPASGKVRTIIENRYASEEPASGSGRMSMRVSYATTTETESSA